MQEEKYRINKLTHKEFMSSKDISSGAKLVLYALVGHLGGKRFCWPSQQRIADTIGISDRQVREHLKRLQDEGFIRISKPEVLGYKNNLIGRSTNIYDLAYFLTNDPEYRNESY